MCILQNRLTISSELSWQLQYDVGTFCGSGDFFYDNRTSIESDNTYCHDLTSIFCYHDMQLVITQSQNICGGEGNNKQLPKTQKLLKNAPKSIKSASFAKIGL